MDKQPILTVNGKDYFMPEKINMLLYRQITEHNDVINDIIDGKTKVDLLEVCLDDLAFVYGVDKDLLGSELDIAEILPTRRAVAKVVSDRVASKFNQIPNGEAAEE